MKKQFLILFAFISVLALSQVPQRFNKVIVTGDITSPKFIKTGSTADSVLLGNGSVRAISTIKTDTTSLSNRINTKQEILVSGTNIRTVNGNSVLGSGDIQIASGGGGSPVNIYLSNVNSTVSGYKEARPNIDVAETVKTITATPANTITWGEKYLYTSPISTTVIPSGFWELHAYGHISTSTGVSKLVFRVLRYSGSTETILATFTGFEVNNTTDAEMFVNGSTNDITVLAGDYLGIQVGFLSDGTSPARTLTYTIGDGHASHFNTPLPTRHSTLRDKNGEADFQHLTAAQITKVNNTSGTNTGDETLTSIKTKLGAATSVSDGYLKYQDFALLHTPTTVTASNGLSISGQNISLQNASLTQSGALTFNDWNTFNSKEPAFSKNTGFNLPLGTTPGTVLEGRTFGTAANSAVGDFILNQNTSAQSANMWISGNGYFGGNIFGNTFNGLSGGDVTISTNTGGGSNIIFKTSGTEAFRIAGGGGAATFSSTVNSTGFLLNGNNLTSSLTTNYIPKWNGSSFVNSLISDDGTKVQIYKSVNADILLTDGTLGTNYGGMLRGYGIIGSGGGVKLGTYDGGRFYPWVTVEAQALTSFISGIVSFTSTTQSTSPTTGALVVGGGVGADHVRANNFYGNGSNLTGIQLPITLTTNGTSGAATFSGNVLNVPNYDVSGGVNQTQTTVNGSTSGTMVCSMPFQTGSYKKVLIALDGLNGSATYTFPSSFSRIPDAVGRGSSGLGIAALSTTSITITSTGSTGWCIIEGY